MVFRRLGAAVPCLVVAVLLASCVTTETTYSEQGADTYSEPDIAQADVDGELADDSRVIDRGLQEGRSQHSGWPAPESYEVDPAFDSPWPTEITRKQLIDSALASAFRYFEENVASDQPSNLTIFFQDTFPEEHHSWVEEMAVVSASFPSDFTDHHFNLMVGEPSWVYEVIEREGFWTEPGGHCGGLTPDGAVGGCASRGAVSANYGETVGSGELSWSGSLPSIVPHEMFHSVQDVLDPKPTGQVLPADNPLHRPLWFWEGGAEFFGYAVSDYSGVASYYVSPWEWWYYLPNPDLGLNSFAERDLFAVPPEGYWMGQIASEYIVANVGVEGMLGISRALGKGKSWPDAFREGTGLALDDFYARFDEAYRYMYDQNQELKTFLTRECPGQWNCYIQRGTEDFERVQAESLESRREKSPGGSDCGDSWWVTCINSPVPLPEEAENSNHGRAVDDPERIGPPDCQGLSQTQQISSGIAATFSHRDTAGAPSAMVSTQWYAKLSLLDDNADGVICSREAPED